MDQALKKWSSCLNGSERALPEENSTRFKQRILSKWHKFTLEAPYRFHVIYETLSEKELLWSEVDIDESRSNQFDWKLPDDIDERDFVIMIGRRIRALDWSLSHDRDHHACIEKPICYCKETDMYIIQSRKWNFQKLAHASQCYHRRGLKYHRIIPKTLRCGCSINLFINDLTRADQCSPISRDVSDIFTIGSALFKNIEHKIRFLENGEFRLDNLMQKPTITGSMRDPRGFDKIIRKQIKHHVDQARKNSCWGVVWPELTVSPSMREIISEYISEDPIGSKYVSPDVIVMGSWHEPINDKIMNTARVCDGRTGVELSTFSKLNPFVREHDTIAFIKENITACSELLVLYTDELLVAFGICKDFCDVSLTSPYDELDVDMVIVISLGNETTILGHRDNAQKVHLRFGAQIFVVQQYHELRSDGQERSHPLGYVLKRHKAPATLTLAEMKQNDTFTLCSGISDTNKNSDMP